MMDVKQLCFLLRGLREMVAVDKDAGLAIADLACRIGERFAARQAGEKDLGPITGFCVKCHHREMEELDRQIAEREETRRKAKARRSGREIRRMVRGRR